MNVCEDHGRPHQDKPPRNSGIDYRCTVNLSNYSKRNKSRCTRYPDSHAVVAVLATLESSHSPWSADEVSPFVMSLRSLFKVPRGS
jgi:hypothetical protein